MKASVENNYMALKEPTLLTEHRWADDVIPLVCVRIMAYNHEKYIRECIDGIIMQITTFRVRIAIHDDASTDKTAQIIREYEEKYPFLIKVVYQKENTYNYPDKLQRRKALIDLMIGKYTAVCEGDDYWTDPMKLQKQVDFLEQNKDYSFCAHTYNIIREQNILQQKAGEENKINYLKSKSTITLENYIKNKSIKTLTVLYKSTYRNDNAFVYDSFNKLKNTSGDWLLFYKLLVLGNCYVFSEEMGTYRINSQGVSQNNDQFHLRTNIICLLKTLDFSLDYKFSEISLNKKKIIFKNMSRLMYYSLISNKNLDLLIYYFRVSIKYFFKK